MNFFSNFIKSELLQVFARSSHDCKNISFKWIFPSHDVSDQLWSGVWLLIHCHGSLGTQMNLVVTDGGLAGSAPKSWSSSKDPQSRTFFTLCRTRPGFNCFYPRWTQRKCWAQLKNVKLFYSHALVLVLEEFTDIVAVLLSLLLSFIVGSHSPPSRTVNVLTVILFIKLYIHLFLIFLVTYFVLFCFWKADFAFFMVLIVLERRWKWMFDSVHYARETEQCKPCQCFLCSTCLK